MSDTRAKARAPRRPPLSGSAFMNITELARLLGTRPARVNSMVAEGKLPPCWIRIGHGPRWQRAHVEQWLRTGEWPAAAWREEG